MEPKKPDMPAFVDYEIVYGEGQETYLALPAIRLPDGDVITRWTPTDEERSAIAAGADIYLQVKTFNGVLQPQRITAEPPDIPVPVKPNVLTFRASPLPGSLECITCRDRPVNEVPTVASQHTGMIPMETYDDLTLIVGKCIMHAIMYHRVMDALLYSQEMEGAECILGVASQRDVETFIGRKIINPNRQLQGELLTGGDEVTN